MSVRFRVVTRRAMSWSFVLVSLFLPVQRAAAQTGGGRHLRAAARTDARLGADARGNFRMMQQMRALERDKSSVAS